VKPFGFSMKLLPPEVSGPRISGPTLPVMELSATIAEISVSVAPDVPAKMPPPAGR
jgi:hypothetical protein